MKVCKSNCSLAKWVHYLRKLSIFKKWVQLENWDRSNIECNFFCSYKLRVWVYWGNFRAYSTLIFDNIQIIVVFVGSTDVALYVSFQILKGLIFQISAKANECANILRLLRENPSVVFFVIIEKNILFEVNVFICIFEHLFHRQSSFWKSI